MTLLCSNGSVARAQQSASKERPGHSAADQIRKERYDELVRLCKETADALDDAEQELALYKKRVDVAKREIAALNSALSESDSQRILQQKRVEILQAQITNDEIIIKELKSLITSLRLEIAALRIERDKLRSSRTKWTAGAFVAGVLIGFLIFKD